MIDEKRIDGIRERCEKATPGSWKVEKYYHDEPCEKYIKAAAIIANDGENTCTVTRNDWSNPVEADLNFIAHAREDIPYLLTRLAESQRRERAAIHDLTEIATGGDPCEYCGSDGENCDVCCVKTADSRDVAYFEWHGPEAGGCE